ncbi:hypothetical protein HPB52_015994 [Rhipicephalus sanguineus]|uniref:Uncharacterized protein n=1 Tax=Rhipicephalus sanguineus TaxID=34632 RepID=A0A9D4PJ34_RHISA|nr:hypothetical protein HPB52_015994 [Rhipicephalus sanguineus]
MARSCCASLVDGVKVAYPYRLQKPLMRKNLDVHLLCQRGSDYQRMLYFESSVKVLSWCLNWYGYHQVLALACLHQKQVVVAASSMVWNDMTVGISQLRNDCCPYITRVSIGEHNPSNPSLQMLHGRQTVFLPSIDDTGPENVAKRVNVGNPAQKLDIPSTRWTLLSGNIIFLGCIMEQDKKAFLECASLERNTLAQALPLLNATFHITAVREGMFASALRNKRVDMMVHSIGLTPDRYQHFHFTANRFGQAVYYVQKRWKRRVDFFLGVFPWLFLLALCMVASASCFVLLNIHLGRRALNGLGEVVLALMVTTLSLSAPIRLEHARSLSGRVIMACWMLACFSLTTYTKSLLTASLMTKPVWEADDSLDKMLPKLQHELARAPLPETFADYVGADNGVVVCSVVSLDDTIEAVRPDYAETSDEEDMDEAAEASASVPTYVDVCYVDNIRWFAGAREEISNLLPDVGALKKKLMRRGWANS